VMLTLAQRKVVTALPPPASSVPSAALPKKHERSRGLGWIVGGSALAAAGVAAGIGFMIAANGKSVDADKIGATLGGASTCAGAVTPIPSACSDVKHALRVQSTLSDAALGSFIVGGVFALGTAGFAIWKPTRASDKKVTVRAVPTASAHASGLIVVGAW
jgi:hypothetical protein